MNSNSQGPCQLLQPTGQRAELHSNEVPGLAAPQHPTRLQSGGSGRHGSDIGPDLVAPKHLSKAHSEVDSGGQPPTRYATGTASSSVTKYPCVRCWKTFKKCPDMVRHFEQLHTTSKRFLCPECNKAHKRKEHVKNHYATRHSSSREVACIPVEVNYTLDPVVFACGFCEGPWQYIPKLSCREDILKALSHVKEHILEGKTRNDWNVTHQIEGLLFRISPVWYEVCRQFFDCPLENWPCLRWTPEVAATFVSKLEQPIAQARLKPLLQELLLARSGPALSSTSGDHIVSDYSQERLDISEHGNEPTQGPLAPLLYSDYVMDDLATTATGDFENLFQPIESSDNNFPQPHNPEEQELLLEATGSQFFPTPLAGGMHYASADILPSEAGQETTEDIGFRNGALFLDPLTTPNWIADQQSMRRPGNELLQSLFPDLPQDFTTGLFPDAELMH
ncbi:hypothetical protein KC316_g12360 [Hortaea werneckii]|nr:hypothetical protein KC324_g12834 [Hortaea werneckii]KAI7568116.1 hypothetical protein KC316_g12360 [Hortaea werneckii]